MYEQSNMCFFLLNKKFDYYHCVIYKKMDYKYEQSNSNGGGLSLYV